MFNTSFGVEMGLFVCADILFESPAVDLVKKYGIKHFPYSVAISSSIVEKPLVELFSGVHKVTLLSSDESHIVC